MADSGPLPRFVHGLCLSSIVMAFRLQRSGFVPSWLTPTALIHDRVVEHAGRVDRVTSVAGALDVGVLIGCVFELGAWALVPLVTLMVAIAAGPLAIGFGRLPECWDFAGRWYVCRDGCRGRDRGWSVEY